MENARRLQSQWSRAVLLTALVACSATEPSGPPADATLVISGATGALEAEFSRTLIASWQDGNGTSAASGVSWSSSRPGIADVNASGIVTGVAPGTATITAQAAGRTASAEIEISPLVHYSQIERNVFNELVFGGNAFRPLRKWDGEIRIQVSGNPTSADRAILDSVVAEIAAALRTIPVSVVEFGGNVQLSFVPESQFATLEGASCAPPAGVWGFSCPVTDTSSRYTHTLVYVSSTRALDIRRYLIRHELMHMAGFYGHPTGVASIIGRPEQVTRDHFLALDKALMEMMGRAELTPGMRGVEAMAILSELTRY